MTEEIATQPFTIKILLKVRLKITHFFFFLSAFFFFSVTIRVLILAVCLSVCDPHNVSEIYGSADGAL